MEESYKINKLGNPNEMCQCNHLLAAHSSLGCIACQCKKFEERKDE